MRRPAAPERRRDPAVVSVRMLVLALIGIAALVWRALPDASPAARPLPWPVFALLFAASETFVVHLHLRRERQGVSLSEITLVLALLFVTPAELVVARVVGELPVFLRRQGPLKAVFNLAQHSVAAGLAAVVYAAVLGRAAPLSPHGWVAAYVAAATAGGCEALAATSVIAIRAWGLDLRAAALAAASGPLQATRGWARSG